MVFQQQRKEEVYVSSSQRKVLVLGGVLLLVGGVCVVVSSATSDSDGPRIRASAKPSLMLSSDLMIENDPHSSEVKKEIGGRGEFVPIPTTSVEAATESATRAWGTHRFAI